MKTAKNLSLRQRILALIKGGVYAPATDDQFNQLALEVFAYQFKHNAFYRRWCESRKLTPAEVAHWKQIPAVPTDAFKHYPLTCFPVEKAVAEFHTSGTTQGQAGKHYFKTLELYDVAIVSGFNTHLIPEYCGGGMRPPTESEKTDRRAIRRVLSLAQHVSAPSCGSGVHRAPLQCLCLMPSPRSAPHSSLSHMMGVVLKSLRGGDGGFFVAGDQLLSEKVAEKLWESQERGWPVMLLGTAFAFVHFFDYCLENGRTFRLPAGSRAMETGGFKGRSREMSKQSLYKLFEQILGITPLRVVNEYGMTELSTQFYDETIRNAKRSDLKLVPPWARVMIVDPHTGAEAVDGGRGLIRVLDLANLYSVMAVQTEDLGVAGNGGFEVVGRANGAEARGCSIAADEMLS